MSMEEQGFFDGLVDDFATSLEMQGAIEASRDENGRVDAAKAAGLSMGMGHTSDDDIALMGAMLGAEGAFDGDDFTGTDDFDGSDFTGNDSFYNSGVDPAPAAPARRFETPRGQNKKLMESWEYECKKAEITVDKNYKTAIAVIIMVLSTLFFLYMTMSDPALTKSYLTLAAVIDVSLFAAVLKIRQNKKTELAALETEYVKSIRTEEKNEKAKQPQNGTASNDGGQNVRAVVGQISMKMKSLFDSADKVCEITVPSFQPEMATGLLSGLFYLTVKRCALPVGLKASVFDRVMSVSGTEYELKGGMLFPRCSNELDSALSKLVNETYTGLTTASFKADRPDDAIELTKTICRLMGLLSKIIERDTGFAGFEKEGSLATINAAEAAFRKMADERLL